jgi:hypothetical protein
MRRFKARGTLAMLLVVLMAVSQPMAAFASSDDPILSTYQDPSEAPYRTSVLDNDVVSVPFLISPTIEALDAPATFFSSEKDAQVVAETVAPFLDSPVSLSAPLEIETEVYDYDGEGSWVIEVTVTLPSDESVGSLSIQAVNEFSSEPENFADYTIIRNPVSALPSVVSVDVRIANPLDGADVVSTDHGLTVPNYYYYDDPDYVNRLFPTAHDATRIASGDSGITPRATDFVFYDTPDTGFSLLSIDFDRTYYGPTERTGWQYRVYRQYASPATVDELTKYVGIDAIELLDGDIVYWAYGLYGDSELFPSAVTPRFPVPPVPPDYLTD